MGYSMPDISHQGAPPVSTDELVKPKGSEQAARSVPAGEPGASLSDTQSVSAARESDDDNVRLVRDTTGGEHYIGPSGGLRFLAQLRHLLSSHNAGDGYGNDGAATKFTQDDTAQALQADSSQADGEETDALPHPNADQSATDELSPGSVNGSIAHNFAKPSAEDMQAGRRELPPPATMDLLLQSYWKHVHQDYPLFHRGTFEEEYEAFVSRSSHPRAAASTSGAASCDWGWVACLRMMLVFGSMSETRIPRIDRVALRRQCVAAARRFLPLLVSRCTLSNVRALILLSLFLHNNNERNTSWVLVGAAVRAAIALGLHRTGALLSFRPVEREERKRVFCTLYGLEQFLASSLGRPSGLNDVDIEVNPPKGVLLGGGNTDGDQLMDLSSSLHQLQSKARVASETQSNHATSVDDVLSSLQDWARRVSCNRSRYIPPIRLGIRLLDALGPDAMDVDQLRAPLGWQDPSHLRETLLLHAEYRYVGLLVTRSALLKDVAASRAQNRLSGASAAVESSNSRSTICLWHASQLAQIVLLLESFGLLDGVSSLDVFYAYSAAMVLILRLLRRPASSSAGSDAQEDEVQKSLEDMVSRLKGAVAKIEKSGTMRRFALVMTTFEECVSKQQQHGESTANGEVGLQMQGAGVRYFNDNLPAIGAPAMTATMQDRLPQGAGMPLAGIGGLNFSGWSCEMADAYGPVPDSDLWMGPGVGMNSDGSPVEWRDVESLLAQIVPPWQ